MCVSIKNNKLHIGTSAAIAGSVEHTLLHSRNCLMSIHVKNNIHWVGQRDWEVRDFHGTEYKTHKGTSYNS